MNRSSQHQSVFQRERLFNGLLVAARDLIVKAHSGVGLYPEQMLQPIPCRDATQGQQPVSAGGAADGNLRPRR
jgi:hypothetical protein